MAKKEKRSKENNEEKKGSRLSRGIANPVRNLIITTVVCVLLGLAFFLKPYEVSQYLGYGAGGLLCLVGVIYILIYFLRKAQNGVYRSEFVIGLVMLLAGAYVLASGFIPDASGRKTGGIGYVVIIRVIGVLIAADGLLKVQYAVDIGRMKFRAWWVALILAVLGVGIGVLTTTDFSKTAVMSATEPVSYLYKIGGTLGLGKDYGTYAAFYGGMKVLGIAFLANAVLDLASLIIIAIRNHKAARAEAIAQASAMIADVKREETGLPAEVPAAPVIEAPVLEPEIPAQPEPAPAPPAPETAETVIVEPPAAE